MTERGDSIEVGGLLASLKGTWLETRDNGKVFPDRDYFESDSINGTSLSDSWAAGHLPFMDRWGMDNHLLIIGSPKQADGFRCICVPFPFRFLLLRRGMDSGFDVGVIGGGQQQKGHVEGFVTLFFDVGDAIDTDDQDRLASRSLCQVFRLPE